MQRSDRSETALREKAQVHTRVAYTAALLTHMNTQTPAHVHTHTRMHIHWCTCNPRSIHTHTHSEQFMSCAPQYQLQYSPSVKIEFNRHKADSPVVFRKKAPLCESKAFLKLSSLHRFLLPPSPSPCILFSSFLSLWGKWRCEKHWSICSLKSCVFGRPAKGLHTKSKEANVTLESLVYHHSGVQKLNSIAFSWSQRTNREWKTNPSSPSSSFFSTFPSSSCSPPAASLLTLRCS